jgi:DNA-binding LacI/PurR family transcriptional regulator
MSAGQDSAAAEAQPQVPNARIAKGIRAAMSEVPMANLKELRAVVSQPGRPLYLTVKDAVREAIDAGMFRPGEQMPSTKDLSERLSVSLVTAHRALQELVASGILQRSQGKGTFVHERYLEQRSAVSTCRVGLVFHSDCSLADYYHNQILEGVRQAAQHLAVDLVLLRFGEDLRRECNSYLYVNPLPREIETVAAQTNRRTPLLVVGARSHLKNVSSIDADNRDLARQAVDHLASLGHTRIGYIGSADDSTNSRDRLAGFVEACESREISCRCQNVIKSASWQLGEAERMAMIRMLSSPERPTAIFAAGYYFALDVYGAAATVGLRLPEDLSIVGVDDPPSAAHLSPALTTLRQPLVQLGHAAVTALCEHVSNSHTALKSRTLKAELVIRRSSAPPSA